MVFTCVTCGVAFVVAQSQRLHFKTEWHHYNLKRKVAELPPIDDKSFQNRLLQQRQKLSADNTAQDTNKVGHQNYCSCCHKSFASKNAFDNHRKSKRHLDTAKKHIDQASNKPEHLFNEKVAKSNGMVPKFEEKILSNEYGIADDDDDGEWSDVDDEANDDESEFTGEPLALEECMFCSHLSKSLESNLKHMTAAHSFFIPDANFLADLKGLMSYLAEKVGIGHMCLWCNERSKMFRSTNDTQRHMRDKGHCKILFEGERAMREYADFYDYSSSYPDNENVEGHGVSRDPEQEVSINSLDDGGYELELPSGAIIGHRSLMRYYRQSLPPVKAQVRRNRALPSVVAHYKGLGWIGTSRESARQRARAIGLMHMKRSKHYMQLGVKANKLQKHFREQVLF